jgi:betaine lipid synthase
MDRFVNVPEFFSSVYLVDFSPSLCGVARKRFQRLGWKNVTVICEDARKFRLEHHEQGMRAGTQSPNGLLNFPRKRSDQGGADLITMSYSLSMIVSSAQRPVVSVVQCL